MRILPFPFFVAVTLFAAPLAASAGDIYISKISTAGSATHEWIEVSNSGESAVDLTGWKFWEAQTNHGLKAVQGDMTLTPGGRAIFAEDAATFISEHPSSTLSVIDSAWSSLSDDGEEIGLRDASGTLQESFVYRATGGGAISREGADSALWCALPNQESAGLEYSCLAETTPEPEPLPAQEPADETPTAPTPETEVPADQEPAAVPVIETAIPTLLLSEVYPAPLAGGKEWVELWNPGTSEVASESCEIHDSTGKIAVQNEGVPAGSYGTVELSSAKLNNAGDTVSVICGDTATDSLTYGGSGADVPDSGQSLARVSLPGGDWRLTTVPTPGSANSIVAPTAEPPKTSASQATARKHEVGRVLVNEIFPGTKGSAWIEIANPESKAISLNGWTLVVGTDAPVTLKGTLSSEEHLLADDLNGPVSGESGIAFLIDAQGYTIDQIVWGSGDNTREDNAPAITIAGHSIARRFDAFQTADGDKDFVLTGTPTPGSSNKCASDEAAIGNLKLNEALPDPEGPDAEGEFIEIKNAGSTPIDLRGWSVSIDGHSPKKLPDVGLAAGALMTLKRDLLKLSLPNAGGTVTLKDPSGSDADSMTYGKLGSGISWAIDEDGMWSETSVPTPGAANRILEPDDPPVAELAIETPESGETAYTFDAGDSFDPDGPLSSLILEFGDGEISFATTTAHSYIRAGRYEVKLTVFDPTGASSTVSRILRVPKKYVTVAIAEPDTTMKAPVAKKTTVKKSSAKTKAKTPTVSVSGIALSDSGALGSRLVAVATDRSNVLLELAKTSDKVKVGDSVNATGTNGTRNGNPLVRVASYSTASGPVPTPLPISDLDEIEALPEYSLVTVEGTVVEKTATSLLLSGEGERKVMLPRTGKRGSYTVGEIVSATGLVRRNADDTTDLVARTIDDLVVKREAPIARTDIPGGSGPISPIGAGAAGTASGVLVTAGWGATSGLRKRIMESIAACRSTGKEAMP